LSSHSANLRGSLVNFFLPIALQCLGPHSNGILHLDGAGDGLPEFERQ